MLEPLDAVGNDVAHAAELVACRRLAAVDADQAALPGISKVGSVSAEI